MQLTQEQQEAKNFLIEKKHAALFLEAGYGKSAPALHAALDLNKGNGLIISTKKSIDNMWKDLVDSSWTLMTYAKFRIMALKKQILPRQFDIIIVDEVHALINPTSKQSKLFKSFSKDVPYVFALTGTPQEHSEIDEFCILHNINAGDFGKISWWEFKHKYCEYEVVYIGGDRTINKPIGFHPHYRDHWKEQVNKYVMRGSLKDVCPDIPCPVMVPLFVDNMDTDKYFEIVSGVFITDKEETTLTRGSANMKAHQAANGWVYNEDKSVYKFTENPKKQRIKNAIRKYNKVLITYCYIQDLEDIRDALGSEMTEDIDEFRNDDTKRALVIQFETAESFNIQDLTDTIICYTYTYRYVAYNQLYHRIYRRGQKSKLLNIYFLVARNTIEESIVATLQIKGTKDDLYNMYHKEVIKFGKTRLKRTQQSSC